MSSSHPSILLCKRLILASISKDCSDFPRGKVFQDDLKALSDSIGQLLQDGTEQGAGASSSSTSGRSSSSTRETHKYLHMAVKLLQTCFNPQKTTELLTLTLSELEGFIKEKNEIKYTLVKSSIHDTLLTDSPAPLFAEPAFSRENQRLERIEATLDKIYIALNPKSKKKVKVQLLALSNLKANLRMTRKSVQAMIQDTNTLIDESRDSLLASCMNRSSKYSNPSTEIEELQGEINDFCFLLVTTRSDLLKGSRPGIETGQYISLQQKCFETKVERSTNALSVKNWTQYKQNIVEHEEGKGKVDRMAEILVSTNLMVQSILPVIELQAQLPKQVKPININVLSAQDASEGMKRVLMELSTLSPNVVLDTFKRVKIPGPKNLFEEELFDFVANCRLKPHNKKI